MIDRGAGMNINILIGKEGYDAIAKEWQLAAEKKGTHFLHFPNWYGANLCIEQPDNIFFVVLRNNEAALSAVLPFQKVAIGKARVRFPILQMYYPNEMGVNDIFVGQEYENLWPLIVKKLRKTLGFFLYVRMQCVLEGSHAVKLVGHKCSIRWTHASKYLTFNNDFDAFLQRYNSKFRTGIQKKIKKIEQLGQLHLVIASSPGDIAAAFDDFLAVEDSGWKGESGTSIRKQPPKLAYYQHLVTEYGAQGLLRINILYLNDEPIAAQLGIQVGTRVYLLKIGYREDFGAYSPGMMILYKVIEHLAQDEVVDSISFVTGVDWIDRWHPELHPVGIFYLNNGHWYSDAAIWILRKAIEYRERKRIKKASELPNLASQ